MNAIPLTESEIEFAARATPVLDHKSARIAQFVAEEAPAGADVRERCRALFYAVRDRIDYEVFDTGLRDADLAGSAVLDAGRGFCLHKSILYATAARHLGVPSRLASGLVRNHLSSPELTALVGGEVFLHWYAEIRLDDRWVKVTPVFNRLLCRMYGIAPLEFDGVHDAVYHPFDLQGHQHMEFLGDVRLHPDPTPDRIRELIGSTHPAMVTPDLRVPSRNRIAGSSPPS
jgi:transglutaminase-like putative cysteine protease